MIFFRFMRIFLVFVNVSSALISTTECYFDELTKSSPCKSLIFRQRFNKMANISPLIDSMLKEYLLFRGFTSTFKALENEIKADKDKSFRVTFFS